MKTYALLNIPERCALVGGQLIVRSPQLLGTTTKVALFTDYGTVWQKSITAGKAYFIPMLIAPQGGMTLYLLINTEAIGPDAREAKSRETDEIAGTLPDIMPKILFSGRLMVPGEEYLDWRKVQVQPVELVQGEVIG